MSPGLFGGMLSFRVSGGQDAAVAVAAKLNLIKRATSLGGECVCVCHRGSTGIYSFTQASVRICAGTESTIQHSKSLEGDRSPTPVDLLRLSVGLENITDLIADLQQALARPATPRAFPAIEPAVEPAAAVAQQHPISIAVETAAPAEEAITPA